MAPTKTNSIFSLKNLLFSLTVLFVALILKLLVPVLFELIVSVVPILWTTLSSLFTPPYLYVLVNFIIIAIAASSRFQQRLEEAASEVLPPLKVHAQPDFYKDSYNEVTKENSWEYKMESEKMEMKPKSNQNLNDLEVKTKKKYVEAKEDVEVKIKKKPMESKSRFEPTYNHIDAFEMKTKKKLVEPKLQFEAPKPKKYRQVEAEKLEDKKKEVETSVKEEEDEYAHPNSVGTPHRTNTIEIPMIYSDKFDLRQLHHEEGLEAGKEVRATEADEEEANDTLDGTWKMIMESRRIQDAGLHEASKKKVDNSKKSHYLRSPSRRT